LRHKGSARARAEALKLASQLQVVVSTATSITQSRNP
jgi:hypothetical protein